MITTALTCMSLSLLAGNVVVIPTRTALVVAGRINWVLREQTFSVPAGTRAIVTRVAPDGDPEVVEVKVFDGTSRHGWVEASGLPESTSIAAPPAAGNLGGSSGHGGRPRDESGADQFRTHCRRRRPDFRLVDAAVASMIQAALQNAAPNYTPPIAHPSTVPGMPVFSMPLYSMPSFAMPLYGMSIF